MAMLTSNLVLDTVILASVVLLLFYVKFFYNYQYWKRRNVPSLPPNFPLGNISYIRPMHHVYQDIYTKIKHELQLPYCGVYAINKPQLIITDQELIKQILIKDFDVFTDHGIFETDDDDDSSPLMKNLFAQKGNNWRKLRNKLSPTFTSGRIKEMFPLIDACGKNLVSVLTQNLSKKSNTSIDVKDYLVRYMTEVIGSTVFGMEINVVENPDCELYRIIQKMSKMNLRMKILMGLGIMFPKIRKALQIDMVDKEVSSFFFGLVRHNIEHRQKHNVKRNDFINLLIQIKKEDPDFTEELITAQCLVFFSAGFDTSSTVLTHALYALAENKDLQTRLRQEISTVKDKHYGDLTYDSYLEMPLLDKVIKESLRLYAPLPQLNRTNNKPWTIPNTDIVIEPNTQFIIPTYGLHHDPAIFPNPDQFDPERFENVDNIPHYAYLPFGEGPRNCIGKRFGLVQLKSGLALLISNFEWNPDPTNDLQYSKGDLGFRLATPLKLKPKPISKQGEL